MSGLEIDADQCSGDRQKSSSKFKLSSNLITLAILVCCSKSSQETTTNQDYATNSNEYCSYENFNPVCSKTEVIVMTSAIYGRMKEGRCLELDIDKLAKQDFKYFGCSDDVLEWMDGKCSGKTECNVRIIDPELRQKSSCFKDLEKYLEAIHTCVNGDDEALFHINTSVFISTFGIHVV